MTTANPNDPFTVESTEDIDVEVVVHANGDRTVVPAGLSDEAKLALSVLSGDELAAAVAEHVEKKDREEAAAKAAEATSTVIGEPPAPSTASTSAAGLAGPDPITQGGTGTGGEGGAGSVFPTTVPAPGTSDAATVKATEAADPTGGTAPVDQPDQAAPTTDGQQLDQAHTNADAAGPTDTGTNVS